MLEMKLPTREQFETVYARDLQASFPEAELKPLREMLAEWKRGEYRPWCLFDGDEIVFCTRYKTAAREYLLRETYAPRRDPVRPHGQRGHRRSPRHTPGDGRARAGADVRR